ncbi:hypothetical protein [Alicyclobacillus macrosporangiidus]|uniref:Uncharacterized protein n=1 Tax=Alicyclobacillus macrosporangiidus TaxID=392015 RepID=A0A1I7IEF7_9BACL|nr:hypothetical protein [Alicyclobacillus macrosporangiidus]SFU71288.1 hypothetical protein SAMN05421543_106170 [Alicyclobacillus macrosporangiidus]
MIYRKLSPTGDYTFGGNANDFYSGTTAVAQAIYTSLRLLQGEWWEDTSRGLPLFQSILGQPGTPEHVRAIDMLVQETILKVQDVVQIKSFQSSYANREYAIQSCIVQTKYGDVVLEGVTF